MTFFKTEVVPVVKLPHQPDRGHNATLFQKSSHLFKSDIRITRDKLQKPRLMLIQTRGTAAAPVKPFTAPILTKLPHPANA
jgi:hypothetical protein